ncbi:MAG: nucleotide exchange factor GrpE [Ruminococcaceae bacterium]|nr:nucleotide exchange factor GrpE [Oscillospiraceae bacterium]
MEETKRPTDETVEQAATEQTEAPEVQSESEEKPTRADKKKMKKAEAEIAELNKKLEEAQAELAAANDKYMRMIAEYENYRRRTAKEKDGIYADAYADALKGILPVLDNLERAVGVSEAEALQKGLAMTLKGAEDALAKMGVTSFGEKGETFDPEKHNAVMHIEDQEHGEGEITEVYQKGYAKGDKILRFAMVIVAN